MPSAEAALFSILTTGSPNPVAAVIETRVYGSALPQTVVYPAIRYARISTARDEWRTLDGREDYARVRMQIDSFALNPLSALILSQAVRDVLVGFQGVVSGMRIDAVATADEAGSVEFGVGPEGQAVYGQRVDVILSHAE